MLSELFIQGPSGRVSFLAQKHGYKLDRYEPGHLQMKGGGNFHDSQLKDFRQLIDYRWSTISDRFFLKQSGECTDQLIHWEQTFERLMIDSVNYWKNSWHIEPTYLVRRAKGESNRSYSLIHAYVFYDGNNPFRDPYWAKGREAHVQINLDPIIEHGPWLSLPPGESSALSLASCFCHNYIFNFDVEDWTLTTVPDDWTIANAANVSEENTIVYSGNASAKVVTTTGLRRGMYQDITDLTIGATYTFQAKIYTESGEPRLFITNTSGFSPIHTSAPFADARWQLASFEFDATLADHRFLIATNTGNPGTFYVDDVHVERCSGTVIVDDDRYIPQKDADDAHIETTGSVIDLTGTLQAGNATTNVLDLGIRFRNVDVPKDATIDEAYIRLVAATTRTMTGIALTIVGEDSATPAKYSTYADFTGRALTTANVAWAPAAWDIGETYDTPDIKTIVQEIVNKGSWASGNSMAIQVQDNGGSARRIDAYSAAGLGMIPMLYVAFDGGSVATSAAACEKTTDPVYIANTQRFAGLTHIYRVDSADNLLSGNLLDQPVNYELFRSPTVVNDGVIFGISDAHPGVNPFDHIIFDLIQGASSTTSYTITWQISDGVGGWTNLAVERDDTDELSETGVSSVHWIRSAGSNAGGLDTYNGVNAWWVKAKLTALTGTFTPPIVQNRHPYTAVLPYVEINSADVLGDIPALSKIIVTNKSYENTPADQVQRVVGGLRTLSRGTEFSSILPFSDMPNHHFASVAVSGADMSFADSDYAATGRAANFLSTPAGTNTATITINEPYASHFVGKFRLYLKYAINVWQDDIELIFRSNWGHQWFVLYDVLTLLPPISTWQVVDLGEINLPAWSNYSGQSLGDLELQIRVDASATADVDFLELILIPVDELIIDSKTGNAILRQFPNLVKYVSGTYADVGETELEMDSVGNPKRSKLSFINQTSDGNTLANWHLNASAPIGYQPNTTQRMYYFQFDESAVLLPNFSARSEIVSTIQSESVNRYSGFRGSR